MATPDPVNQICMRCGRTFNGDDAFRAHQHPRLGFCFNEPAMERAGLSRSDTGQWVLLKGEKA